MELEARELGRTSREVILSEINLMEVTQMKVRNLRVQGMVN